VQVDRGETETVDVELMPREGGLVVNARDEKGNDLAADVWLDDVRIGTTPLAKQMLIGSYKLKVAHGGRQVEQDVEVKEKQVERIKVELEVGHEPSSAGGKAGMEWVTIAGGTFMMGSNRGDSDEKPVHRVTVSTFQMAKTEVTVGQYRACVKAGACTKPDTGKYCNWGKRGRDDHPINCVDWHQANAFAKWAGGRLPTEAQWEYAARGGGKDRKYPWGDAEATCRYAVMDDKSTKGSAGSETDGCGMDRTWPVCSKTRGNTEQGLCDMAGNVWEWCRDWYGSDYYKSSPSKDPVGPSTGSVRVERGGSWLNFARDVRAAYRNWLAPGYRYIYLGFRPVRSSR